MDSARPATPARPPLTLPLLSGVLLALSFPPYHFLFPPFVALVPLLAYCDRAPRARDAAAGGLVLGVVFHIGLLYWITLFTSAGFVLLLIYLSLYPVAFAVGAAWLRRRGGRAALAWGAPALWIVLEHLRAQGELAFTWGQLAYSLTRFPLLLQAADLGGSSLISWGIAGINAALFVAWTRWRERGSLLRPLGAAALVIAALLLYGAWRWTGRGPAPQGHLRAALLQPSIDQDKKWDAAYRDWTFSTLTRQTLEGAARGAQVVIWPETAAPTYLRRDPAAQRLLGALAMEVGVPLVVGAPDYEFLDSTNYESYNAAFVLHPSGQIDPRVYRKMHLVPFGEKTPFEDRWAPLRRVDLGGGHFTEGPEFTLFPLAGARAGVLICFESIFPELSRGFRLRGATVLLNITNDAWFQRTSAPYQHAAACVLRAIENRISILRSANTGVSLLVDPLGRVKETTPIFVRAVAVGEVPIAGPAPPYTRWGDWPIPLAWALLGVLVVRGARGRP